MHSIFLKNLIIPIKLNIAMENKFKHIILLAGILISNSIFGQIELPIDFENEQGVCPGISGIGQFRVLIL